MVAESTVTTANTVVAEHGMAAETVAIQASKKVHLFEHIF